MHFIITDMKDGEDVVSEHKIHKADDDEEGDEDDDDEEEGKEEHEV